VSGIINTAWAALQCFMMSEVSLGALYYVWY